jgi:hypothetical protein
MCRAYRTPIVPPVLAEIRLAAYPLIHLDEGDVRPWSSSTDLLVSTSYLC